MTPLRNGSPSILSSIPRTVSDGEKPTVDSRQLLDRRPLRPRQEAERQASLRFRSPSALLRLTRTSGPISSRATWLYAAPSPVSTRLCVPRRLSVLCRGSGQEIRDPGAVTEKKNNHRGEWIRARLQPLASLFAIEACSYARCTTTIMGRNSQVSMRRVESARPFNLHRAGQSVSLERLMSLTKA
jgi:hypothetical protein